MRKFLTFSTIFLLVALCATSVLAQSQSPTVVTGLARESVARDFGTPTVGGFSGGTSTGTYKAEDLCLASGDAKANGKASGFSWEKPNEVFSLAKSKVSSSGNADGRLSAEVTLSGKSQQANWGEIGIPDINRAVGWNTTSGEYDGSISSTHHGVSGEGFSESFGKTKLGVSETPTSRTAEGFTTGNSVAKMDFGRHGTGTTNVSGEGGLSLFSTISSGPGDTYYAGALGDGSAKYNGVGDLFSAGSLNINGKTNVSVSPNKVEASSTMSSTAKITGGDCGGHPCGGKK